MGAGSSIRLSGRSHLAAMVNLGAFFRLVCGGPGCCSGSDGAIRLELMEDFGAFAHDVSRFVVIREGSWRKIRPWSGRVFGLGMRYRVFADTSEGISRCFSQRLVCECIVSRTQESSNRRVQRSIRYGGCWRVGMLNGVSQEV